MILVIFSLSSASIELPGRVTVKLTAAVLSIETQLKTMSLQKINHFNHFNHILYTAALCFRADPELRLWTNWKMLKMLKMIKMLK